MPIVDLVPQTINRDVPVDRLPLEAVTAARNIVPEDRLLQQAIGYKTIGPAPLQFAPRYLLATQSESTAYWIYGGDTGVGVTDLGTLDADITPASGFGPVAGLQAPYTGGIIEQNPVLNILNSGPYWWDRNPANPLQLLPDWPVNDVCEAMRPFREFLVAMNILADGTRVPDLVRVSDAAPPGLVPQSWTPGPDTQAVERSVGFNPGGLVDGLQLIDRFYMYKTNSVFLLQYVAGQFIFSVRPVFSTFGALSRNCVVEWRGQHIVLTDGDVVIHDGINVQSLVDERVRREIFDNLDGTSQDNAYLFLNAADESVAVCRPRPGETFPSEAWIISLSGDNAIGQFELQPETPHVGYGIVAQGQGGLQESWADKTTTWATDPTRWNESSFLRTADEAVLADHGNQELFDAEAGSTQAGDAIEAQLERAGISLGEPDRRKYARRVWPTFEAALGAVFTIEVGAHDRPDADPAYGPPQTFTVGTDRYVNVSAQGYYLAYRVTAVGQLPWRVSGMQLEVEGMGRY